METITVTEIKRNDSGELIKVERTATPEEISKLNELIEAEKQKRKALTNN